LAQILDACLGGSQLLVAAEAIQFDRVELRFESRAPLPDVGKAHLVLGIAERIESLIKLLARPL
jgi:hypothetical protein